MPKTQTAAQLSLTTTTRLSRNLRHLRSAIFGDPIGSLGFFLLMAIILMSVFGPIWFPLDTVSDPANC